MKRILIFRVGHIGDTLVALPALWHIRRSNPNSALTLLSNGSDSDPATVAARSILPARGLIDEWISYPAGAGLADLLSLIRTIRRGRYDAAVYLMNRNRPLRTAIRDKWFFRACGIRSLIGFDHYLRTRFEGDLTRYQTPNVREADYLFECVAGVSDEAPVIDGSIALTSEERAAADRWIAQQCAGFERFVAVAPGSKWASKIWSEENFISVIEKLIEDRNAFPIVFGGPEDRERGKRLIARCGRGANAAGELNIREAAAAIEKCYLYLGNDTGTMHLAASVGVTCIPVFAAVDVPGRWHPIGEKHLVFREQIDCGGCNLTTCPIGNACLEHISPSTVYDACVQVLDEEISTRSGASGQAIPV